VAWLVEWLEDVECLVELLVVGLCVDVALCFVELLVLSLCVVELRVVVVGLLVVCVVLVELWLDVEV
jgi:hypothetical protein